MAGIWTALGPAPVANGQTVGNQPVSGRIAGLAADPTDADIIYVAAAGGGVWKTINGGTNWAPLTDNEQTLTMGAVAVAPSNPSVVYAGTGEFVLTSGRGILVSNNGGTTWTMTGANVFDRRTISKIVVDPNEANIAYAASGWGRDSVFPNSGVYKTIDGGANWINTTSSLTTSAAFSDVAIDPTNSSVLYAAIGEPFGNFSNGFYKSVNGGGSWSLLNNLPNGSQDGRIVIAVAPSNPSIIYVSIAAPSGGPLYKLERTDDGGDTWNDLTVNTPNFLGDQGWYDTVLIVDPSNPDIVYGAGQTLGVQTTDGGATWNSIIFDSNFHGPHADSHAAAFDANGKLLVGTDGGIWRLDNANIGSLIWTDLNTNLNTIQFEGIALHPTSSSVALGGTQDNGTVRYSGSSSWTTTDGSDGGFVKYSLQNTNRVYHVTQFTPDFFRRSDDNGLNWTPKNTGLSNAGAQFYAPFIVDPNNGDHVLLGTNVIYETTDAAENWSPITTLGVNGWSSGNGVVALALAPSNSNTIYASTGFNIYVTTDKIHWTQCNLPVVGEVHDIQVDPNNSQIAYAVISNFQSGGHVFRTTNGGATWTNISGNLPDLPTWTLQIHPTFANTLYIGNDDGVYVTNNLGGTWSRMGNGLPRAQVFQLDLNTNYNILAAGTYGRGMWEIDANAPSSVVGRRLFYNQSGTGGATVRYDGNNLAINALDDNAIATDKVAYLPGAGPATFANMSSYSKGINGIMVDISGSHPSITAADFVFHVGNNNSPSTWALANPPTSISVRAGAGVSGSDRVEIIWNSGAPFKQWLEVAVLATANTGLAPLGGGYSGARATWGDVFYFGNAVGNSGLGDTAVNSTVNAIDEGGARSNPQVVGNNIPITNIYDWNRNAVVNAVDEGVSRLNATNSATVLKYLNLANPPLAPEGDGGGGGGDTGVASALTATAPAGPEANVPRWLGLRLEELDLNSGRVADAFQSLHDFNTPTARKLLVRAGRVADALGLDDELLSSILADLGLAQLKVMRSRGPEHMSRAIPICAKEP